MCLHLNVPRWTGDYIFEELHHPENQVAVLKLLNSRKSCLLYTSDADRLQLCAQAMALEERLVCEVPRGGLFYASTRKRETVELTAELRQKTQDAADEMKRYFSRGYTPKVRPGKHCNACSLKDLCLPALCRKADAAEYIHAHMTGKEEEGL